MTPSRGRTTATAVVTVAGLVVSSTCGSPPSNGVPARPERDVSSQLRACGAAPSIKVRTRSRDGRPAVAAGSADPAASAKPVNSSERPWLRNSWTWTARSPKVAR
ncbi:hypothetical protein ALI22I_21905 [Saccharothrix sp. ALI-22-I]|uniref:hypothetical protein n=1 Tax=Saccharothrix sp. ALI-22-I TaxID=1933778 RepID=UPI00097BB2A1|nr:hypothetical protein [Saccharothrix sp. ALI-22-I]ONI87123.1 hypothetical protein ALI22I_21905 [Saccharothrix sp. ALI-22-I]